MDTEQALAKIDSLISQAKDSEDRFLAAGYVEAVFDMGLIDSNQFEQLRIKALDIRL